MDQLLAKLSVQQVLLEQQKDALTSGDKAFSYYEQDDSTSGSDLLTPVTDSTSTGSDHESDEKTIKVGEADMARLQKELDAAKDKIARQEQELSQTRVVNQIPALATDLPMLTGNKPDTIDRAITNLQSAFTASIRPTAIYSHHEDVRSDNCDLVPTNASNRGPNIWGSGPGPGPAFNPGSAGHSNLWDQATNRAWLNRPMAPALAPLMMPQQMPPQLQHQMHHRVFSGPSSPVSTGNGRFMNDFNQFQSYQGLRRSNTQSSRAGSAYSGSSFPQSRNNGWDPYGNTVDGSPIQGMSPASAFSPMGMFQAPMPYQPRPIGTPLSPTAAEFTAGGGSGGPWNSTVSPEISL